MSKKMNGLMRLIAAITVSVILLPYLIQSYLVLSPKPDANEVWLSFIQAAPFGDWIGTLVLSIWGEAKSGADSLLEWMLSPQISFPAYLTMELGELVFQSVIVLVMSCLVGRKIFYRTEGGFFDHAANAVFQVLLTFIACLIVNVLMELAVAYLVLPEGVMQGVMAWVYGLSLGAGGIALLIVCGVIFLNAILLVAIGCLKLLVSYGYFLWLVRIEIEHEAGWMLAVGVILWLVMIWLLQSLESLFLPKQ